MAVALRRREILRTERLRVTSWMPGDAVDLAVIHADAETMRYVREGRPETHAETEALIAQYIDEDARTGLTKWRLVDVEDRLVGRAGFGLLEGGLELGYTIRRSQWGRGLATEIAAALVNWHRDNFDGVHLVAYVAVPNHASVRVLEKVGFVYTRTEEHHGEPCRLYLGPTN